MPLAHEKTDFLQGLNAIDAAITCGVKHIILNGSENIKKTIGKDCNNLDSKAAIEEYLREVGKYGVVDIGMTLYEHSYLY